MLMHWRIRIPAAYRIGFISLVTVVGLSPAYAATSNISANYGNGSIIVGYNSTACSTGLQGAVRYASGSPGVLTFCDGVNSGWTSAGGSATPAGATTQIQFNSGGSSFGASANFTWDNTNNIVAIANSGTGAIRSGNGTVLLPSHGFTASTSTGMWMSAVGTNMDFAVGGINALQMSAASSAVNYLKLTPSATGVAPSITNLGSDTNGAGLGVTISGGTAGTGSSRPVTVAAGDGSGSGLGGALTITGGAAGGSGAGGSIAISGGAGGTNSGDGGNVTLSTGAITSGTYGSMFWKPGGTTYLTLQPAGTIRAAVVMGGTTSLTLPSGTTAQRPTAGVDGMLRYNTTNGKFEGYQNGNWTNIVNGTATQSLDDLTDAVTNYTGTAGTTASLYSMFVGAGAGTSATTGAQYNTSLGVQAMQSLTTGVENTAFGYQALMSNTTGSYNSAFGSQALALNTTGSNNTAFGFRALYSNTTGSRNTAAGANALAANQTGTDLTAAGYAALGANQTGSFNTAIGSYAMTTLTNGSYNTAAGAYSMASMEGNYNTFVGYGAGYGGTNGDNNVGIGFLALSSANFYGSNNVAIGTNAGANVTGGTNNVFVGRNTGVTTTSGSNNIIIGHGLNASSSTASNEMNIGGRFLGTLGGSNYVSYDANQHMNYAGSTPTNGGCGTATVAGNDNQFIVTHTAGSITGCTINFANSWTNIPTCTVSANITGIFNITALTTAAITITQAANSSSTMYVICRGYL